MKRLTLAQKRQLAKKRRVRTKKKKSVYKSIADIRREEVSTIKKHAFFRGKRIESIETARVGVGMSKVYVRNPRKKQGYDLYLVGIKTVVISPYGVTPRRTAMIVNRIGKVKDVFRPVSVYVGNNFGKNLKTELSLSPQELMMIVNKRRKR